MNYFSIYVFDDGNQIYEAYENIWSIIGHGRGKVKLLNIDKITIIESISRWKLINIDNREYITTVAI
tara:strand:- start:249 stop:449 length:201 start_codon:yes stop_codon:yes gene_type:complete